ncbi:DUF4099 domain-containing protein [Hymenobacter nivis]|uniref:DUF3945 domain-containing protein n=1 Tax=Hymenobacter nivis TaxID=1850093 RepID=A0A502GGM4_9BACT|nr:topoisomerase C-terminal repeat-containing protein [Hymenobacter nivis]TPG60931.1 DUF3945 domain-containing protein [Hymenobacter nivis]
MAENIEPKTGNEQKAPYPVARANQQAHPDTELGQESIKPIQAPAQVKPVTRPAAKAKTPVDERDEFIRNALPVAAALRKAGNPEEAKKLELVANAILQTKSMERAPAPEQAQSPAKEESIKDLLASVYKTIDQNPALKNMPEAKDMRRAGNKLDKDGMLNITVRNGVVVSFVSNFTDNFSRTQQESATEPKPAVAQATPAVEAGAQSIEAPTSQVVAMPVPTAQVISTPTPAAQVVAAPIASVQEAAPKFQAYPAYTSFAPSTETGVVEPRKLSSNASPQLNVAMSDKGEFGINPQVNQPRLIGDGISSLSKFFDYQLPTSGLKIAHVGLAEPGQMKQTEKGWEVVTKGKLALTDTAGNVFKPLVGAAQQIAPVAPAQVVQQAPAAGQAVPTPAPAQSRGEVIYAAAPPDSSGNLNKQVLQTQAAHYSMFQIRVDPQDSNRAILLPAPGADGRLVNSLRDSMDNAYNLNGRPEQGKAFLAVETPTQLARTADGWRVTEKGLVGFSAAETVYQAPSVAVQQAPQQATLATPFTRADVSVEELARVGVQVADLEKSGQLQRLLEGKKTDLIPFVLPTSDGVAVPFEAKLVLQRDAQGVASLRVDLPKYELEIPKQIMGKDITPAMQVQLQANGVVPLAEGFKDGQGQPFAAYLAVDKEMKRVVAVPREGISVPREVHGVKLSAEQTKQLLEGRPTRIQGMTNSKQQLVDATVQLDPLARKLTFRDSQPRVAQEQTQSQVQQPARRRGVGV